MCMQCAHWCPPLSLCLIPSRNNLSMTLELEFSSWAGNQQALVILLSQHPQSTGVTDLCEIMLSLIYGCWDLNIDLKHS